MAPCRHPPLLFLLANQTRNSSTADNTTTSKQQKTRRLDSDKNAPCFKSSEADEGGLGVRVLVETESCLGDSAAERVIQALRNEERLCELVQELVLGDGRLRQREGQGYHGRRRARKARKDRRFRRE